MFVHYLSIYLLIPLSICSFVYLAFKRSKYLPQCYLAAPPGLVHGVCTAGCEVQAAASIAPRCGMHCAGNLHARPREYEGTILHSKVTVPVSTCSWKKKLFKKKPSGRIPERVRLNQSPSYTAKHASGKMRNRITVKNIYQILK